MKTMITVIIPVFNSEKYISQCLESVLAQTFTNFELLLVNDGSTDRTGLICDKYAKIDSRVKVFHKKNGGVSSARNIAIKHAKGEFITFLDSDDYLDKYFLDSAYNILYKHNADLYISGLYMENYINDQLVTTKVYTNNKIKNYKLKDFLDAFMQDYPQICVCGVCCKLFKRNLIIKYCLSFDETMSRGEDTNFVFDYLKNSKSIYFDSNVFYHYRRTENYSLYGGFYKDTYFIYQKVYGKLRKLMIDNQCLSIDAYDLISIEMLIGSIHTYFAYPNETSFDMRVDIIKQISGDHLIKAIKLKKIKNKKHRIIVWFLKRRFYLIIYFIFHMYYYKKFNKEGRKIT